MRKWRVFVQRIVHSSIPACPVQELLLEESRLIVLCNAAKQSPVGTPLAFPEDRRHTSREIIKCSATDKSLNICTIAATFAA